MHFSTDLLTRYSSYGLADPANAVDYGFNSLLERISDFAYYFVRIVDFILRCSRASFRSVYRFSLVTIASTSESQQL